MIALPSDDIRNLIEMPLPLCMRPLPLPLARFKVLFIIFVHVAKHLLIAGPCLLKKAHCLPVVIDACVVRHGEHNCHQVSAFVGVHVKQLIGHDTHRRPCCRPWWKSTPQHCCRAGWAVEGCRRSHYPCRPCRTEREQMSKVGSRFILQSYQMVTDFIYFLF